MALVRMKAEISEDEFNLVKFNTKYLCKVISEIAERMSYSTEGYGMVDPRWEIKDGKYYVTWGRFSSCD